MSAVATAVLGARGVPASAVVRREVAHAQGGVWDRSALLAAMLAALAGTIALVWSFRSDWILIYSDAISHLNIARRVLDNRTPGIAQLGTVWLPLPHVLMQPFVANSTLWGDGLAGSFVGLPCFVVAATMVFQTTRLVVQREAAAWVALLVFITNPNVLYLQTTALTEPVLLMTLTTSTYYLVRWSRMESNADLVKAAFFASLAVGSRYDGWFFSIACGGLVLFSTHLRWRDVDRTEGTTLAYLTLPVFAMGCWVFYNWLIFGDPLAFQHGRYSAAYQQSQYAAAGLLPTKGHLLVALQAYSGAVLLDLGSIVTVLGATGLIIYIAQNRLRPQSFAIYSYLSAYVFNVIALFLGQTIIATPLSHPAGYFNTRYGLVALPAAAFMSGYAVDFFIRRYRLLLSGTVLAGLLVVQAALWAPAWPMRVVSIADGLDQTSAASAPLASAHWLRAHYHGGGILYNDAHSQFIAVAGINMGEYYLIGPQQTAALADPAHYAKWMVLEGKNSTDPVDTALWGTPYLRRHYTLQFSASGYEIYLRIGGATK